MDNLLLAVIALGIVLAVGWLISANRNRQLSIRLDQAEAQISSLTDNLNILCSSAVGVDQRVNRLERHGRAMESRQESFETSRKSDRPYSEAIEMVHKGATVDRLIEELQLSRSEAELLHMLHGVKEAV